MSEFVKNSLVIVTSLIIVSCGDPGKWLIIKASSKPGVSVTIYTHKKLFKPWDYPRENVDSTKQVVIDTDNLIIHIASQNIHYKSDTTFDFGIGVWDDTVLEDFVSKTDSIVICNSNGTNRLNTKIKIKDYARNHLSGFANHILTIEAK